MTFINSGYGANNHSNSLNNISSQGISSSATLPSASATQSFEKSMQGAGGNMDLSKLIPLLEQFLQILKGGGSEGGSQTENGQGSGGSGGGSSCSGVGGSHAGNTGSSNGSDGSAGGAGSLGDKEGNGGGAISNTDRGRKGDEASNDAGKNGKKGKSSCAC